MQFFTSRAKPPSFRRCLHHFCCNGQCPGTGVGWWYSKKASGRRASCATFLSPFSPTERSASHVCTNCRSNTEIGKGPGTRQHHQRESDADLKKQPGFVDETLLVSDEEPNRILALSFWNNKEDAERYQREQYPAIQEMVRHLLEAEPVVRTFNVESSTAHRILAEKAA